jgi:hypothetical protein
MVAIGKAGTVCPSFRSEEDDRGGAAARLEKRLEGVLFPFLHIETLPVGISIHPGQSLGLLSFSIHAAPVHTEKDHRGQAKIPKAFIVTPIQTLDIRL